MMKKSILAITIASTLALTAAQADTVLYGSIRYDYTNTKNDFVTFDPQTGNSTKSSSKHLSNLNDAGSRIGLKGSEDLGNHNAVIYHLEWAFDGMAQPTGGASSADGFKNRLAYFGFTGEWGTFTAGRQNNPFQALIVSDHIADTFNGSGIISSASQRAMTTTLGAASINDASFSRLGKVIAYSTPVTAGFQANAALMMNADLYSETPQYQHNQQKNIDLWTINAKYQHDINADASILAQAGYINGKLADNNSSKAWGLFLGYSQESFDITASYVNGRHTEQGALLPQAPKEKSQGWDLGASFAFGANNFSPIRANYGENQLKIDGDKDKVKSWAIGFEQKLSTRTRTWIEYGKENTQYHDTPLKSKHSAISIGMRHDF